MAKHRRPQGNLYYHPTWFIGKTIEFREGRVAHQLHVDSIDRLAGELEGLEGVMVFSGRIVMNGTITPVSAKVGIRNLDWRLVGSSRKSAK